MSKEGGGAGNNWASGFTQGEQVQEILLDMIGKHFPADTEATQQIPMQMLLL